MKDENPMIALANLSGKDLTVKIPVSEIKEKSCKKDFSLKRLLCIKGEHPKNMVIEKENPYTLFVTDRFVSIKLNAYNSVLFEVF